MKPIYAEEVCNDLKVKAYEINKRMNGYIAYLSVKDRKHDS